MTKQEIEMAIDSLFDGAARVRAKKHEQKIANTVHRQFSARINSQMWDEDKRSIKDA